MTVENTISKTGKQVMGSYTYDFSFDELLKDPTEEVAKQAIKCAISDGTTETILTYGTDYSVALNSNRKGGQVTVVNPRNSSWTITIYRSYEATQGADYNDFDAFPAETLEQCLDKMTMLIQEIKEELTRCVKTSISDLRSPEQILTDFRTEMQNQVDNAENSKTAAANSATAAANSATSANTAAGIAMQKANAAASSAAAAEAAKTYAQNAITDENLIAVATDLADENSYIKAAQPNAQAAAASATAAAGSATSAATSATNAANSATSANTAANRALMFETAAAESEESAVASATAALNSAEIAETAASNILNNDNIKNVANHIVNINKTAVHVSEISTVSAHVISINTLSETIREYNTDIHGGHADTVFTQSIHGGQADTTEFSESLHGGHADTRFPDKFTADMQTIADNITDIQNAEENAIRAETAAEYAEETAATIAADKAIIESATTEFIRRYDSDQFQNTANATKYITALGGMTGYIMSVIAYLRSLGKIIAGGLADTTVFASTLHGGQADTTTFAENIHGGTADIIFN